jgi:hypothetical protein
MTGDDKKQERPTERSSDVAQAQEKDLAEVCGRFADICQYLSQENMDLPPQIVDEVRQVSQLAVGDRIARMKRLNQELMEYLNDADPAPQIRQ